MSRGLGEMQREVLDALTRREDLDRPEFWHDLEGLAIFAEAPTAPEHATFKRAVRSLGQRGLVEQSIRTGRVGHDLHVIVRLPFLPSDHRDAVGMGIRASAIDEAVSNGESPAEGDSDWLAWYRDVPDHVYVGTEFYGWPGT